MRVAFERTGERSYATVVMLAGEPPRRTDPAPGYDDEIPHDLVHYLVEAELGLSHGVYGRAAAGGGAFVSTSSAGSARQHARARRRQKKREAALSREDEGDMARSEYIVGLCDLAWRRRAGAETPTWAEGAQLPPEESQVIARVLALLDEVAPRWKKLPIGEALVFRWPNVRLR